MNHFISIAQTSTDELNHVLDVAHRLKHQLKMTGHNDPILAGRTLALIFEKPSLRTRVSFAVAMTQLGGTGMLLRDEEIGLGKREPVQDVARVLSGMCDGIMARTFGHDKVLNLAKWATVPVINGLTDYSHPCQAMADMLTLQEVKGRSSGLKLAYVGDGNNVAHSLLFAGAQLGAHVVIGCPPGYEPKDDALEWAQARAKTTGGSCTVTHDPIEAAKNADALYTDVWASMGQESEAEARKQVFRPYQVNAALFAQAKPDAIFLHCLPAHRGEEVTDEVIDSPRSVVFQEAENRLHAQKAVLHELMRSAVGAKA